MKNSLIVLLLFACAIKAIAGCYTGSTAPSLSNNAPADQTCISVSYTSDGSCNGYGDHDGINCQTTDVNDNAYIVRRGVWVEVMPGSGWCDNFVVQTPPAGRTYKKVTTTTGCKKAP